MIAALFVDPKGSYANVEGVDLWDEKRDARKYAGPHPVVAHPPCQLWVNFAALNFKRYGGEHNRPGNDGGCFVSALASIRRYGGVLEHPAFSNAFKAHRLERPVREGWQLARRPLLRLDAAKNLVRPPDEWVCEVWQSAYGHKARKRTWLYAVSDAKPPELNWRRPPGTHQVGWFDRIKPTLSKREASATPEEFRDALLNIARTARKS